MLRGLHFKLALMVSLGALMLAGAGSILLYRQSYNASVRHSERSLQQLLATVQVTAGIAAYVQNPELGKQVVDGLVINDIVLGAEIRDHDAYRVQAGKFDPSASSTTIDQALTSPIAPEETVGTLRVLPNRALIAQRAGSAANTATIGLAAHTFLVAFLVMGVVYVMLTKPLVGLSVGLHRIVPGEKERLNPNQQHRRDEFGRLVDDINRLLDTAETMFAQERSLRARVESLEQRFRGIFEGTSAGIFLMRESGVLMTANPAFYRTLRMPNDAIGEVGGEGSLNIEPLFADPDVMHGLIRTALQAQRPVSADLCLTVEQAGEPVWVHALFSPSSHVPGARLIEGVIYDVTERKRTEAKNRRRAEHDTLTGLPNRHAAELHVGEQIARTLERGVRFSLLLIDLDRFKPINDSHGHEAGDRVLVEVAGRMRRVVRAGDFVARLGGDEFLIVLADNDDPTTPQRVAQKLVEGLLDPIEVLPGVFERTGASIGIAWFPQHASTAEALRAAADAAMYAVKRAGRNGFAIYAAEGQHQVQLLGRAS